MRKSLLLILISFSTCLFSQTSVYHAFPDSNAAWSVGSGYLSGNTPVQCSEWNWIQGDTIVGTNIYHKIYRYYTCWYLSPPYLFYSGYYGAIRQDTLQKKVYYLSNTSSTEELLYDFNLSLGDTLGLSYINSVNANRVVYIDSVLIGVTYNNRYWLSPLGQINPWDSAYAALIEGVGSTLGLLFPLYPPFESGSSLTCFWKNGQPVYPDSSSACPFATSINDTPIEDVSIAVAPNPSTGSFTISSSEEFFFSVHDIFGRTVVLPSNQPSTLSTTVEMSPEPKGIYFVRIKQGEKEILRKIVLQ